MEEIFARVVVDLPARGIGSKYFHYRVPGDKAPGLKPGMRVSVPFGGRSLQGFVTGLDPRPEVDRVKDITRVLDPYPLLTGELMELAGWVSRCYLCTLVEALKAIMPGFQSVAGAREITRAHISADPGEVRGLLPGLEKKAPRQAAVLRALLEGGGMRLPELLKKTGASHPAVKRLAEKGLLQLVKEEVTRGPFREKVYALYPRLELNPRQAEVLGEIRGSRAAGETAPLLLHGVTGSGKTEIYLQAIEEVLGEGREAIFLVPEISLTPQMIKWFRGRFGSQVTVLHSRLSPGERYDQWRLALEGKVKIVVGPRSAIFAPFKNLGIIIIDEEHEGVYKQEEVPRYDAREVARQRSLFHRCPLLLGSATPSLESYYQASGGKARLLTLGDRVEGRPLPPVRIVDQKKELVTGNRSFFSRELQGAIQGVLERQEQVILFLNRRGFATFVVCRDCGHALGCPHCSITLTFHAAAQVLKCHYCNYQARPPGECPACRGGYIRFLGLGTQRVEKDAKEMFPGARVLRLDMDSTSRKGSHQEILGTFRRGEADILVGTQMVAKGLDFPRVTLVGVVLADTALHFPDFRAGERTFQLLTQVAGRTGRSHRGGRVIIQTFSPEHYSITLAREHDYQGFYSREIKMREEFQYPPFTRLVRVIFSSPGGEILPGAAGAFRERLVEIWQGPGARGIEILGPVPCPVEKTRGRYRWHLVLKGNRIEDMAGAALQVQEEMYRKRDGPGDLRISLDVDPLNML